MMDYQPIAVQVDFVIRLADEKGDSGPRGFIMEPLAKAYDTVTDIDGFAGLHSGDKRIANFEMGAFMLPQCKRDFAMAMAGYHWYWSALDSITDEPVKDHYNDGHVKDLLSSCEKKLAPYFRLASIGAIKPQFVSLERKDIIHLGEGYRSNPLDTPGFEDVSLRVTGSSARRISGG